MALSDSATAGRFTVTTEACSVTIEGPADYLASGHYQTAKANASTSAVVQHALGTGCSIPAALAVYFQTDYAAFAGLRGLNSLRGA